MGHEFTAFIEIQSVPEVIKDRLEEEWIKHTTESNVKIDAVLRKTLKERKKHSKGIKLRKIVKLVTVTLIIV